MHQLNQEKSKLGGLKYKVEQKQFEEFVEGPEMEVNAVNSKVFKYYLKDSSQPSYKRISFGLFDSSRCQIFLYNHKQSVEGFFKSVTIPEQFDCKKVISSSGSLDEESAGLFLTTVLDSKSNSLFLKISYDISLEAEPIFQEF